MQKAEGCYTVTFLPFPNEEMICAAPVCCTAQFEDHAHAVFDALKATGEYKLGVMMFMPDDEANPVPCRTYRSLTDNKPKGNPCLKLVKQ